jgi:hypothetical protein
VKKELWAPFALAGLAVIFAAVCLGLWLSRGNHWWLKRKLRIGALMLTLTGVANGCTCASCYTGPASVITLDGQYSGAELVLDLASGTRIQGKVEHSILDEDAPIPFHLLEMDGGLVQVGALVAKDGAFDERTEKLYLDLRADTQPGYYEIEIYDPDSQLPDGGFSYPLATFGLEVIDSR